MGYGLTMGWDFLAKPGHFAERQVPRPESSFQMQMKYTSSYLRTTSPNNYVLVSTATKGT